LNEAGKDAAKKAGRTPLTFHQLDSKKGTERFHDAITAAKDKLKFGASVHAYDAGEYANTKMYVTPDDKAGFALKPDGDIVSAFSSKSKVQRAGDSILALAVQQGGKKLDAFDTVLPAIYSDNGFRAVARLKWNDEFAPPDWDYKTFGKFNGGRPDVVFMVHDPDNAKPYKPGDGKLVKSYDEAVALQDAAIKQIDKGKGKHPGEGYSKEAYVDKNGVIQTNSVYDAQRALFENRKVELKQVKQVSTLIKRLGETAAEMAEHGEDAPVFNLCNVTVKGTNLFCADQIGIPRAEMPVIPAKRTKDFIAHLKSLGYDIKKDNEESRNLRASQSEISGAKVAVQMQRIKEDGFYKRLVISRDNYILDGHHTWAGQLGLDAKDGDLENDGREVKVARVDISITKLIDEADKWTKAEGIAKKPAGQKEYKLISLKQAQAELDPATYRKFADIAYRFFAVNTHLGRSIDEILITVPVKEWDEGKHPREPAGSPTGGEFTSGGGGVGGASPSKPKGKKTTKDDFDKAKVRITSNDAAFIEKWNDKIGVDPEDFKKTFTGGLGDRVDVSMSESAGTFRVSGNIKDAKGHTIGEFDRDLKPDTKSAYSAYFKLNRAATGGDVGKKILGGNVEMYRELGFDKVTVSANIDVGGYAWAKYGYVPTPGSWSALSAELERKLDLTSSGRGRTTSDNSYEAEEWDIIPSDQQEETFRLWARDSRDEFVESEINNWRESGQALEQAKNDLVDLYNEGDIPEWANDAINEARDSSDKPIPFTNKQLFDAMSLDYKSRYEDGRDDPEITFDDNKLQAPEGYDPAQGTLPGIESEDPAQRLSEKMRDELTSNMVSAFNDKAESDANDINPPDYIYDSVEEYQGEYWDQFDDRTKLRHAIDYGQANIPLDDEDQEPLDLTEEQKESPEIAELYDALRESNPKNIWKIADSSLGKKLLLNSSWSGVLDLKDKASMDRFNKYVGRAKVA
jgi:hypothetical protein